MRWIAVAAGVLLVASVLAGSEEQAAEEESPFVYTLEVNGKPHPIKPGKLLTLAVHEGLIKVRLKVEPYRVFRTTGMEFRFPRGFQLERKERRSGKKWENWSLRMRGFRLGVLMRRGERDAANVVDRRIELMRRVVKGIVGSKEERVRVKVIRNDRPLRLAGHKVAGTTYDDGGFVRTYYALRTGPDTVQFTFFEVRRDSVPGSEPSTTWKEMERWLEESLKVLPPMDK